MAADYAFYIDTDAFPNEVPAYADAEKTRPLPRVIPLVQGFRGTLRIGFLGAYAPDAASRVSLSLRAIGSDDDAVRTADATRVDDAEDGVVRYDFDLRIDTTVLSAAIGKKESLALRGGILVLEGYDDALVRNEFQLAFSVAKTALGAGNAPDPSPTALEAHNADEDAHPAIRAQIAAESDRAKAEEAALGDRLASEGAARERADAANAAAIAAEADRAKAAETALSESIATEAAARAQSDAANAAVIDAEAERAKAAEAALSESIATEAAARAQGDATNAAAIAAEADRAKAAETALGDHLASEGAAREQADTANAAAIAAEAAARAASDAELAARLDALDAALGAGNGSAAEKFSELADKISEAVASEGAERAAADSELSCALAAETMRATDAETALERKFDAYATKEWTNSAIAAQQHVDRVVVETLPETGKEGVTYYVPAADPESDDLYDAWIWLNGKWERESSRRIDLSGYARQECLSSEQAAREASDAALAERLDALDGSFIARLAAETAERKTGDDAVRSEFSEADAALASELAQTSDALSAHVSSTSNPHRTSYGYTLAYINQAISLPSSWTGGEVIFNDGTGATDAVNFRESRYPAYLSYSAARGNTSAQLFVGKSIAADSVLEAALHYFDSASAAYWGIHASASGNEVYGKPLVVPAALELVHATNLKQLHAATSALLTGSLEKVTLAEANLGSTATAGMLTVNGNANCYGWFGTFAELGVSDESVAPLRIRLFRRASTNPAATGALPLYLRVLRVVDDAWTVAYESTNAITMNDYASAGAEMEWMMRNTDGRGAIPAGEQVALVAVLSPDADAQSSVIFGTRTTGDYAGGLSAALTSTAPTVQTWGVALEADYAKPGAYSTTDVSAHLANGEIHITASERAAWNKAVADTVAQAQDIAFLSERLAAETASRESADSALTARLNDIVVNAGASAEAVQANLAAEIQRAKAAEAALSESLASETSARAQGDAANAAALVAETERATARENEIAAALSGGEYTAGGADYDDNAGVYGYYGTLAALGCTGESVTPKSLTLYRRTGNVSGDNTFAACFLRILRVVDGAWTVAYQSTNSVVAGNQTLAGEPLEAWALENADGRGAIPADEPIAIVQVLAATAPAATSVNFGCKVTSARGGALTAAIAENAGTLTAAEGYAPAMTLVYASDGLASRVEAAESELASVKEQLPGLAEKTWVSSEIAEAVSNASVDLTGYATTVALEAKAVALSEKITSEQTRALAAEAALSARVAAAESAIAETAAAIPDVSGFAETTWVSSEIAEAVSNVSVDLTGYATTVALEAETAARTQAVSALSEKVSSENSRALAAEAALAVRIDELDARIDELDAAGGGSGSTIDTSDFARLSMPKNAFAGRVTACRVCAGSILGNCAGVRFRMNVGWNCGAEARLSLHSQFGLNSPFVAGYAYGSYRYTSSSTRGIAAFSQGMDSSGFLPNGVGFGLGYMSDTTSDSCLRGVVYYGRGSKMPDGILCSDVSLFLPEHTTSRDYDEGADCFFSLCKMSSGNSSHLGVLYSRRPMFVVPVRQSYYDALETPRPDTLYLIIAEN